MIPFMLVVVTLIGAALALFLAATGNPAFLVGVGIMVAGFTVISMILINTKADKK